MKIIIPMAGMGKRMRPHTLTTPKPLLQVAGKSIVEHLITDIAKMCQDQVIEEVSFIIGNFGKEVENRLLALTDQLGYPGKIYYQLEAKGTAHALHCAKESLNGNVLVAYADTLFHTDFVINPNEDGYIWVKQIPDPSQFGVVVCDKNGYIQQFVEKPKDAISDLAIIGIYYFKDGEALKNEIQYLIDHNITGNGEFQLTDALENMKQKNTRFKIAKVSGWFDCGNKNATVATNTEVLKLKAKANDEKLKHYTGTIITEPCFIGENVQITNSKIGPYVSLGNGTIIDNCELSECIIGENSTLKNSNTSNSMIGRFCTLENIEKLQLSLGDYSEIK